MLTEPSDNRRHSDTTAGAAAHPNILRSAGVVSAAILLSRVTGLAREIAFARLFGAGMVNDAFVLGFRIPNRFVIGYGLDVDERYRNLPFVAEYNGDLSGQ